jgi:hypothetical protein
MLYTVLTYIFGMKHVLCVKNFQQNNVLNICGFSVKFNSFRMLYRGKLCTELTY